MKAVAALDCGTNSTRLLVADDGGQPLERLMRITRLGKGVDASGILRDDAIERTLEVLREYRAVMDRHDVATARLVATSAVRDASNGEAFLAAASDVTGVPAELLSGEEEGRLSFAGATADLEGPLDSTVVVDIGGGSTELVTRVDGTINAHSMQAGCVRVTERALRSDPPTASELAAAASMIDDALDLAFEAIPVLSKPDGARTLVGLAGTVSTLAMIDLEMTEYDEARVHHHWLSAESIERWRDTLAAETIDDHRRRPGMVPGREDVIVGGACILLEVVRRLGVDGCLCSEHDILDGLAQSVRAR
ncbi:MAG TPA: Ppx/GppA phosphatase family protein [Acidimicrobiales bacterium]